MGEPVVGLERPRRPWEFRNCFQKVFTKFAGFIGMPYDIEPTPSYDVMLGFPGARKERVMQVTQAELDDYGVPQSRRDYCAHHFIALERCKRDNWGIGMKHRCAPVIHHMKDCQYDDLILRVKEYERERRMQARKQRRIAKGLEPPPKEPLPEPFPVMESFLWKPNLRTKGKNPRH